MEIKNGDKVNDSELIDIHYEHLLRFCKSLAHSDEEAEEIFQETMLRATMNCLLLSTLKEYQVKSWLFRVAKNYYIDRLRKTDKEEELDEVSETEIVGLENLSMNEFETMVSCLPEKLKLVVKYKYYCGYDSREIANLLNIPMGTVRSRLHLSLNKIKENLED